MKKPVLITAGRIGLHLFCNVCIRIVYSVAETSSSEFKNNSVGMNGFREELVHTDSPLFSTHNISCIEWLEGAVKRSKKRLKSFNDGRIGKMEATDLGAAVNRGNGEFAMKLAIGTPGVAIAGIVDIGSDLTWTQCKSCIDCFAQSTPIFFPLYPPLIKSSPVLIPSVLPKLFPNFHANLSPASTLTLMAISPSAEEFFPLRFSLLVPPNQKLGLQRRKFCLGVAMTMKEVDSIKQVELLFWEEGHFL